MSLDTFWAIGLLKPKEVGPLAEALSGAGRRPQSADTKRALKAWRARPDALPTNRDFYAFLDPFMPFSATEDGVEPPGALTVVTLNGMAAPAVLFFGLGPDHADLLPGSFGNMVITAKEVRAALDSVERAHSVSPKDYRKRARSILEVSGNDPDEEADAIFRAIPEGLAAAAKKKLGFFAICFQP